MILTARRGDLPGFIPFQLMQFQISNTPQGYVVEAYVIDDPNSLRGHWHPLRNFGDRQGDAIAFRDFDAPQLPDAHIRALIKAYNPETKYIRVNGQKFIKQRPR